MSIDNRCYLKTDPSNIFYLGGPCRHCEGDNKSCDRYVPRSVMDEIRKRDRHNRGRPIKALDDYVNEEVRLNGR